ncbi:unnamed protein product [Chondrus crispus]|uniref:Uncharacterized protein n=1 Tax=Chondrus crispus TaxID=2769 RepID=R7QEV8_CHOCR|nr:unnamed protein product [Chondrus crispus]CDF37037.1 unnamed protein product [Chondrus crispus]|eukprot:XP_005716856.1 unnamed protein product [Chondrus crispus]
MIILPSWKRRTLGLRIRTTARMAMSLLTQELRSCLIPPMSRRCQSVPLHRMTLTRMRSSALSKCLDSRTMATWISSRTTFLRWAFCARSQFSVTTVISVLRSRRRKTSRLPLTGSRTQLRPSLIRDLYLLRRSSLSLR